MNRIFVDMDGVVVDFDRFMRERGLTGDQVKVMPQAYLKMEPIPGSIDALRSLIGMGFEVWLATKPPTGIPGAYADKVAWVLNHLPELKRRVILTHDKGLLGDAGDYLIDDRPHRANCAAFPGHLITYHASGMQWPEILTLFRRVRDDAELRRLQPVACPHDVPYRYSCDRCLDEAAEVVA